MKILNCFTRNRLSATFVRRFSERISFLHGNDVKTFLECGVPEDIAKSLSRLGLNNACSIQQSAIPPIRKGHDVVIGSETGSGKTLCYLLPLIEECLKHKASKFPLAVILLPTRELCFQVEGVAHKILAELDAAHDVCAEAIVNAGPTNIWPYRTTNAPSILICTPSLIANFHRVPQDMDKELFAAIKYLVLDEADLLLEGSYARDMHLIFTAFKRISRMTQHDTQQELNNQINHENKRQDINSRNYDIIDNNMTKKIIPLRTYHNVQTIFCAATMPTMGLKSVSSFIDWRFPHAVKIHNSFVHKHHPRLRQTFHQVAEEQLGKGKGKGMVGTEVFSAEHVRLVVQAICRQLPQDNDDDKDKHDISNSATLNIKYSTSADSSPPAASGTVTVPQSTMLFVNTARAAVSLAAVLRAQHGIDCVEFHKHLTVPDRLTNFARFQDRECSVLVCTDMAARGLDLPHVRHVVQVQFAENVVHHLHRIGRATRAGVLGHATNFFDSYSLQLVQSLLNTADLSELAESDCGLPMSLDSESDDSDDIDMDPPHGSLVSSVPKGKVTEAVAAAGREGVEQSFSRRRGFRHKLKKIEKNLIVE